MKLEDDAPLDFDWSAFGAAEMLGEYFSGRGEEDVFLRLQEDLTELVREVISSNTSSRDRLLGLGLTDYDIARFYVASSVVHWAVRHGFEDSQGNDRRNYLSRLFQDCIHDLRVRDALATRYVSYLEAKFEEVMAARVTLVDDPHDVMHQPTSPDASPSLIQSDDSN